jgi:uncharacterized protein (TIGR02444 family)
MTPGAFWTWSLATYARPGVADACLELQDRLGLDVNRLLLAWWLAANGLALPETADALAAFADPWQRQVVGPLRSVRRALKGSALPGATALREAVKAAELEAERLEQHELERLTAMAGPAEGTPGELVARNLRVLGQEADAGSLARLADAIGSAAAHK